MALTTVFFSAIKIMLGISRCYRQLFSGMKSVIFNSIWGHITIPCLPYGNGTFDVLGLWRSELVILSFEQVKLSPSNVKLSKTATAMLTSPCLNSNLLNQDYQYWSQLFMVWSLLRQSYFPRLQILPLTKPPSAPATE